MSEFDKEAEREKLREKYGEDQSDREATEHMSELLLQGATMTNKHCDACGDPVFRQNGQEFCPTCGQAADQDVAERTAAVETDSGDGQPAPADRQPTASDASPQPEVSTGHQQPQSRAPPEPQGGDTAEEPSTPPAQHAGMPSGDLAEAQAALAESITQLARQATQESDPRQAKERLAAAREAAEALDALRR